MAWIIRQEIKIDLAGALISVKGNFIIISSFSVLDGPQMHITDSIYVFYLWLIITSGLRIELIQPRQPYQRLLSIHFALPHFADRKSAYWKGNLLKSIII